MTSTLNENSASPAESAQPELAAQLSAHWALAPRHLLLVGFWCLLALVLNYLPLRGTDLWGHVAYGHWIMEHRALPVEDPFAPLTAGMRVVDSAWLSQVALAAVQRQLGDEGLSTLFTLATLASLLLLARVCYLQSGRLLVSFAAVLTALVVGWSRLGTIRPENFGCLAFAALLWLLARHGLLDRQPLPNQTEDRSPHTAGRWSLPLAVGLVMMLWANLHGSFVCGLALLGCLAGGRAWEAAWSARGASLSTRCSLAVGAPPARRLLVLLEVATLATLINPYGVDLLIYSLGFSNNANLAGVLEWAPMTFLGVGGREFALSWIALTVVLRHSRRRVRAGELLAVAMFAVAAACRLRMISWYAPVLAVFLAPHLAEIWNRFAPQPEVEPQLAANDHPFRLSRGRAWSYSLMALLLVWITFAVSPMGRPVVGDPPRAPQSLYDSATPLGAAEHLRQQPPQGQIFNPQWWGDYLVWQGPPGLQPFMTTNMHLAPRQVWRDYQRILGAQPGWQAALERYGIGTVVLDKQRQSALTRLLRRDSRWRVAFEDRQAVVLRRVERTSASEVASPAPVRVEHVFPKSLVAGKLSLFEPRVALAGKRLRSTLGYLARSATPDILCEARS